MSILHFLNKLYAKIEEHNDFVGSIRLNQKTLDWLYEYAVVVFTVKKGKKLLWDAVCKVDDSLADNEFVVVGQYEDKNTAKGQYVKSDYQESGSLD